MPALALSICRRIALARPINGEAACIAHDGHDKTVVIQIDRNAKIDVTRKRERLAVEPRVDLRIGRNRQASCSRNERQKCQREPVCLLKSFLTSLPHAIDRGEINLDSLEYMRNCSPGSRQDGLRSSAAPCSTDDVVLPSERRRRRRRRRDGPDGGAGGRGRCPSAARTTAPPIFFRLVAWLPLQDRRCRARAAQSACGRRELGSRRSVPWRVQSCRVGVDTSSRGERHCRTFVAEASPGAAAAVAPSPTTATTSPTFAVTPALTRISDSRPATIACTSIVTLSVSTSNRLSPSLISSPTDLNQARILPSVTVSPSCGMMTVEVMGLNRSARAAPCRQFARRWAVPGLQDDRRPAAECAES